MSPSMRKHVLAKMKQNIRHCGGVFRREQPNLPAAHTVYGKDAPDRD